VIRAPAGPRPGRTKRADRRPRPESKEGASGTGPPGRDFTTEAPAEQRPMPPVTRNRDPRGPLFCTKVLICDASAGTGARGRILVAKRAMSRATAPSSAPATVIVGRPSHTLVRTGAARPALRTAAQTVQPRLAQAKPNSWSTRSGGDRSIEQATITETSFHGFHNHPYPSSQLLILRLRPDFKSLSLEFSRCSSPARRRRAAGRGAVGATWGAT
jgi:hypothetical protein